MPYKSGGEAIIGVLTGEVSVYFAPFATALPQVRNGKLRNAAISGMNNAVVNKRLTDLGYVIIGDQPEEFAAHLRSEIASLAKILKGLRTD